MEMLLPFFIIKSFCILWVGWGRGRSGNEHFLKDFPTSFTQNFHELQKEVVLRVLVQTDHKHNANTATHKNKHSL